MDKQIVSKVKSLLEAHDIESIDLLKVKLMKLLKPDQAETLLEYFTFVEPEYVQIKYGISAAKIIPVYADYFKPRDPITSILFDDYDDNE